MIADVLRMLLETNLAAAAAIAVVLMLRRQVQLRLGPGAAYMMWLIVPVAMLATFIPARTILMAAAPVMDAPDMVAGAVASPASVSATMIDWNTAVMAALVAWVAGAVAMAAALARRQLQFMADMGRGEAGPAVVGFFRPHIVTPDDFHERFSLPEQRLVLAHESVHLERHDTRINAVVALVRCACWFNPLMHVGAHRLRIDQEMACDATVIERRPRARRLYAETLLKTQLATRALPIGCHWPPSLDVHGSQHPLAERITMLTRHPFSERRRLFAAGAVIAIAAGAGVAAWAAQPVREIPRAPSPPAAALPATGVDPAEQTIFILSPAIDDASGPRVSPDEPQQPPAISATTATTRPAPGADFTMPAYPAESVAKREEGDVLVELCVASTGRVETAKLVKSSGHDRLDEATMQGLQLAQFQPATLNGEPVRVCEYLLAYRWGLPQPETSPDSSR